MARGEVPDLVAWRGLPNLVAWRGLPNLVVRFVGASGEDGSPPPRHWGKVASLRPLVKDGESPTLWQEGTFTSLWQEGAPLPWVEGGVSTPCGKERYSPLCGNVGEGVPNLVERRAGDSHLLARDRGVGCLVCPPVYLCLFRR